MPKDSQPLQSMNSLKRPLQEAHLQRAQASIRQAVARNAAILQEIERQTFDSRNLAAIKADLDQLSGLSSKLNQTLLRIAVFGLVSRGKSAVLNALMGQDVFQTGPTHGVTQWPRSVYWSPDAGQPNAAFQVELIDTPGLDEIEGEERGQMAESIARQSDLILFVVAGDITRTEYQALQQLWREHKPILLVFNKTDLYPDQDRQTIFQKLKMLGQQLLEEENSAPISTPDDIVMVAADPVGMEVRVEWPDGRITQEWETPPPQIDELRQKLTQIIQTEGRSLLALNALRQSSLLEVRIAQRITDLRQTEAEALIWKYARYKAIAIAVNPIALFDLAGGAIADLLLIRALSRLYGLPMTGYEAGKLWRTILKSSGGQLASEVGSGILMGASKTASIFSAFENPANLFTVAGTMALQAGASGYGTYAVGRAAQAYLEQGCTWGPQGANTVIQDILRQVDADSVLERLRQELGQSTSDDHTTDNFDSDFDELRAGSAGNPTTSIRDSIY